ncbi:MAG: hypothetical protein J7J28_06355 [Thaumarchaeota archaeon]|nr:hypothetical protein [Nitrososphaerota archaeon]
MSKEDKLRSLKPGDLIEVLWGDACLYERVSDRMLRNLKPKHLDTPMRTEELEAQTSRHADEKRWETYRDHGR